MSQTTIERLNEALSGRYEIERELGRGGMAVVYLARDVKHGRSVALKVLPPDLGGAAGTERFLREIEIAAGLNHPNILALHDSGEAEGSLYFVMPFVEGESLRDRLEERGRLSMGEAITIIREVGSAIGYAHERGLIHRDIKPENVLFQAGHAMVCDFGIAKIAGDARDRMTRTGVSLGTFSYMSPEQLTEDESVDHRSDVYALGCLLFEMLEGDVPFRASSRQAAMVKKLVGELPDESSRTDLPLTVYDVIRKALATDPEDRFETAPELVLALDHATTEIAIERDQRRRRREKLVRRLAAGGAIVALAAAGWWTTSRIEAPPVEYLAVVPQMSGDTSVDYFVNDVFRDLTVELAKVGVRVKSPGALTRYLDGPLSIPRIANDLGVDGVVLVGADLTGDSVASQLQLIDPETEDFVWVEDFSGDQRTIRSLLGEMTVALAEQVGIEVGAEQRERYASAPETDPQVLEYLQRADLAWERLTEESLSQALRYYELARDRDPTSAEAWNGIAQVWFLRAQQGLISSAEANERAAPALDSALHYDPTMAQIQSSIGGRKTWGEWDWDGAREAFETALEANPADATTRAYYSLLLLYIGEPERSLAEAERARTDDPLNALIQGLYAQNLHARGRAAEARDVLLAALEYDENVPFLLSTLRTSYHLLGDYDHAIDSWRASFSPEGSYSADQEQDEEALAVLDGYSGGRESYEETLAAVAELLIRRSRVDYVTPWRIGSLYARAHDRDHAIEWLTRAVEERDQNSPYLAVEDTFDYLRDDPRFEALIRRMGLPLETPPEPVS